VPEYMGVAPGWGDVYTWDLPAQYIDISNVPDGVYEVVSRSNPDGGLLTADRGQETGITCVRITGSAVQTLKELPSRPNSAPLRSCRASGGRREGTGFRTSKARAALASPSRSPRAWGTAGSAGRRRAPPRGSRPRPGCPSPRRAGRRSPAAT